MRTIPHAGDVAALFIYPLITDGLQQEFGALTSEQMAIVAIGFIVALVVLRAAVGCLVRIIVIGAILAALVYTFLL